MNSETNVLRSVCATGRNCYNLNLGARVRSKKKKKKRKEEEEEEEEKPVTLEVNSCHRPWHVSIRDFSSHFFLPKVYKTS